MGVSKYLHRNSPPMEGCHGHWGSRSGRGGSLCLGSHLEGWHEVTGWNLLRMTPHPNPLPQGEREFYMYTLLNTYIQFVVMKVNVIVETPYMGVSKYLHRNSLPLEGCLKGEVFLFVW